MYRVRGTKIRQLALSCIMIHVPGMRLNRTIVFQFSQMFAQRTYLAHRPL